MLDALLRISELPNLHPAFVHFPIALLPTAVLFETAGLVLRRQLWLPRAATALYALAALGALAARWAGRRAADTLVDVAATVQPHIGTHSDWADRATWAISALAAARLLIFFWERKVPRIGVRALVLVAGVACLVLLTKTADLGGGLVFRHGLGVGTTDGHSHDGGADDKHDPSAAPKVDEVAEESPRRPDVSADGRWSWRPTRTDRQALGEVLQPAAGTAAEAVRFGDDDAESVGLPLAIDGRALLLLPPTFGDVQIEATLALDGFEGTFGLAHHIGDPPENTARGGYFELTTDGGAELVDLRDGNRKVLSTDHFDLPNSELTIAVSVSGRHLKGLLDGRTLTHGHVATLPAGACGLVFDGQGTLRVLEIVVVPLGGH